MTLRPLLVVAHRWFGLSVALFLFIAGATGSVIAWEQELDSFLNPQLFHAHSADISSHGRVLSCLEAANQVEARDKRLQVIYVLTAGDATHTCMMMVEGRINPVTMTPYDLDFNQIAVDPVSADVQGKRMWGALSVTRENLLPFLYKLHYTMFLPNISSIETGIWLMGVIGLVWIVDCFIAIWLSFPKWSSWRKSFAFRWQQGGYKLSFDLHRSGGVWVWGLLLVLAVTSVSMNLERQVVRPVIQKFSSLTPDAFDLRTPHTPATSPPHISREQAIQLANAEAQRRGWLSPVGGIFYSSSFDLYGVGFFSAGNDRGDTGLGNTWIYIDANNGHIAGEKIPGQGTAGDLFLQVQFPLHSGRILGLAGRIFISTTGLLVALLSVTGVIIWLKKRRARLNKKM